MQGSGKSIVDVSRRAGVSVATVSRVINNNPRVSPSAVGAVRRAMAELNYTPPPPERRYRRRPHTARKPNGVLHGNAALLFPDSRDMALRTALSGRLMHGMNEALLGRGLHMIVTPLMPDGSLPACIANREVDGVIVRGATEVTEISELLAPLGVPVVWLMTTNPEVPSVGDQVMEDVAELGALGADYLLRRGHRKLVAINPVPGHASYGVRIEAFVKAVKQRTARDAAEGVESGIGVEVIEAEASMEDLIRRVVAWEKETLSEVGLFLPLPDNELSAAYRVLREMGVTPGRDIGFIGCSYDPTRLGTLDPGLANVDVRAEAIAAAAGELLLWRLTHREEPRRRVMVAPGLVVPAANAPAGSAYAVQSGIAQNGGGTGVGGGAGFASMPEQVLSPFAQTAGAGASGGTPR